jgi:hypothetical protein
MLTVADLKKRCNVKTNGCWEWPGATDAQGYPSVWSRDLGERTSLGVFIGLLTTGKRPAKGYRWYVTCETPHCANPAHRKEGTVSEAMSLARGRKTRTFSPLARSRISMSRRARPTKLNEELAREIRASEEPQKALARKYGVCQSTISHVISGRVWRELGGSSVFTFRP